MDLVQKFNSAFQKSPVLHAESPGRVNLIGEHTDYNDGFVMPIAIQYAVHVLASPRTDQEIHLASVDFSGQVRFNLSEPIAYDASLTWSNYQRGVIDQLLKRGHKLTGANLLIQGNVPIGAGLSSSAAVEVATAAAMNRLNQLDIPMIELVKLSQAAENQFVGMNCGIMDQFISGMGKKGMALLLDCRSLEYELVPFPDEQFTVMIMNTKVKRELTGTEYNERRSQCEEGVRILRDKLPGIKALRDVSVENFELHRAVLPERVAKRCHHVIYENDRTRAFADALKAKDTRKMGHLLLQSHENLRDLFEVSCKELDLMVELAMEVEGTVGARMTGAGFGGCAIAIVEKGREKALENKIYSEYPGKSGIEPEIYISSPSEGATVVRL